MDVARLINSILADDSYNTLSEETKNIVEQYLHTPTTMHNEVGTNTPSETGNKPEIDFDMLNNSTSIREANFLELQRDIEVLNDQFKNALKQKHELMLQNENLLKNLHEAEVRERMTKIDDGILQLKIDTLTQNLLKCSDNYSNLQLKYHKEVNELKPDLDQKQAEVLTLKNNLNLLQIKSKIEEDTNNILKREFEESNKEHVNEMEQLKKELINNESLMNHYKECYENEVAHNKNLTDDIEESRNYVVSLTTSLNDAENNLSKLSNEYEEYKIAKDNTIFVLTNKLNASEEIVKQIFPGNTDTSNYLIRQDTTITDVYAIYKETCLNLQAKTQELEESKNNFEILKQQIKEDASMVDKLENDMAESNEKVKILCETISKLELKLEDVKNKLQFSNSKCDELSQENETLRSTENDLSKQVCFLLRNIQCNKRFENRNSGVDMSPQSIISNNYVTFEDIQGLQKQNKKLVQVLRSLSKAKDEQELKLIKDLKEEIKILEEKLKTQALLVTQQKEMIMKMQSYDDKPIMLLKQVNDVEQHRIQITTKSTTKSDEENKYRVSVENVETLKHQLSIANKTINQLKEKLECSSNARIELDHHVQGLNHQIDEILGKIKTSNIRQTENLEKIAALQSTVSTMDHENHEVKIELEKIKSQYSNTKKENDSLYISNMNYSRELRQKTELQKEFEKTLTSQLDSLIINWNLTLAYIAETDYDKVKFKDEYKKLTKTLKDVRDNLLLKLEAIEDSSTCKEMSRSRTNSLSLCSDERSNFQNVVGKLEHEVKNLKTKLNESDQLKNQLKSELNVTKQLYKSLEENLKKMNEYSSQLENEREMKKKEYLEKDQQLLNAMQELSEFNVSQKNNINKLQNQLIEYEQNNSKILEELEMTKEQNNKSLETITQQNNNLVALEEELKKITNDKDKLEKGLNHKLTHYKNKLERLDSLELFNKTKSAEIDYLKNQKSVMEKSIEEIKIIHKTQIVKLQDEINCLKETIKRWQFENELLSEQYKSITNELINGERLNNSKISDNEESIKNTLTTNVFDKQFTKMANLINILKDEKNTIILELNELNTECNKLKSDLQYKSKVIDDMQTQMKELRQLHSSDIVTDNDHSKILEKIEFCNKTVEKIKILEEENILLSNQLRELQELDAKKTAEITALKDDMSGMQSLIDQKSAEIVSAQKNIARWKERSNGTYSDAEYKQLLNTLEREKGKMTTALDQLKSMKSDKSCLEELLKKLETDHSEELNSAKQEIIKLKTKIISNNKSMESFKNIIKTYRQKFTDIASEIYKVKVLARRYKHLSEELHNTLSTERSSWQTKLDEIQQGGSKVSIDPVDRKKLIEQGKQEQKIETESLINELTAKVVEAEAGLSAAKSEVEVTKATSADKEMRAKQLLQQVRSRIQNLSKELDTTKKQRDSLSARLDEAESGSRIQEYQAQITHLDQENRKLLTEKEQITLEKDRLSHDIQMLNHRVTALMRQFSNQQVKPSTSTGPDKLAIEPPTANIKPLGPAVNKPQPVHHSVTVNPWRSAAAETPLASIKPMTMQPRSVVVLPTSQTSSSSIQSSMGGSSSNSTTITVHPQQPQSVDISSSGGNASDSSEANSTAQSRHLTSSTLAQHVEGSESTATVSDSNETTTASPTTILPLQQALGGTATPSVTAAQANPAISIALVVPQGREQVQTTVSQPTTVSVSTVSPSQSQTDSAQNENGQAMESSSSSSSSSSNSNIASSTAPGPSTESEPSVVTAGSNGPSCSSLDTTTHSNNTQRKRKADFLVTSYMKRSKSFMPREENRREMEYEAPTSSQRDSEVSNSYTGQESNPQDSKEVEASTDMEVTSEAALGNNEVDLTSQECTADTNNMNETNDIQNEETEQTTGENTPEHSSSNAEATAMDIEEDAPEIIRFQEFQNTPVSSASCEETKSTDNVTSDLESRQNESDSTPIESQAGTSSDTMDTVGVSQSTENAETNTLDLEQETIEILSSENEEEGIEMKSTNDVEETENNECPNPDIISVSSSPSKDNEAVCEESPVAGPSGVTSDSSTNERKPITWNE